MARFFVVGFALLAACAFASGHYGGLDVFTYNPTEKVFITKVEFDDEVPTGYEIDVYFHSGFNYTNSVLRVVLVNENRTLTTTTWNNSDDCAEAGAGKICTFYPIGLGDLTLHRYTQLTIWENSTSTTILSLKEGFHDGIAGTSNHVVQGEGCSDLHFSFVHNTSTTSKTLPPSGFTFNADLCTERAAPAVIYTRSDDDKGFGPMSIGIMVGSFVVLCVALGLTFISQRTKSHIQ